MAEISLDRGIEKLNKRTSIVAVLIYIYIVVTVLVVACMIAELTGNLDLDAGNALSMLAGFIYLAFAITMFTAIVIIGMWIYRANANLRAAGNDDMEFTPSSAVGWYFVPIANFFKPFQAMREIWSISHRDPEGYLAPVDSTLGIWWGFWVCGNILSNVGLRMDGSGGSGGVTTGLVLNIASSFLLIVAAWFLLRIVKSVNEAQSSMVGLAETFA